MSGGHRLDLLNDGLSWVNLIDNSEESRQFSPVPGQRLQLLNQVISALVGEKGQLVDITAVAFLSELQRVLLQVESTQELINR